LRCFVHKIGFFPLLKNLDFSNIFLDGYAGIEGERLTISTVLSLDEPVFDEVLTFGTLGVNLLMTLFLKELLLLSVLMVS